MAKRGLSVGDRGYIYLLRMPDGSAKIGHSEMPFRRLHGYRADGVIAMTHVFAGSRGMETAIHRRLRQFSRGGHHWEWYPKHDDYLATVFREHDDLPQVQQAVSSHPEAANMDAQQATGSGS
jgi:hypothetical protein